MHSLAENRGFVNKNHELAWRCIDAGIPIAPAINLKNVFANREYITTDKNKVNEYLQTNPDCNPMIFLETSFYKFVLQDGACPPYPLDETLCFTNDRRETIHLYKYNNEFPECDGIDLLYL